MAAPAAEAQVSLLDDRIGILDRNAAEASPAGQVLRTVGAVLALVRVRALFLRSPLDSPISPMAWPGRND